MIIDELRARSRGALHAVDDSNHYSDAEIDRAAMTLLDDLVTEVKPVVASGTVALGGTVSAVTFSGTTFTTFSPERAIRFEIRRYNEPAAEPGHVLERKDYSAVARDIRTGTVASTTCTPTAIGFRDRTAAFLDSAPGTTYPDGRLTWYDTLNRWTPGTTTPGTTVINVPDEYLGIPVWFGISAVIQHTDPASFYQTEAWRRYEDFRDRMKGKVHFDSGIQQVDYDAYL